MGMTFENGEDYLVSFVAKSELAKTMNVNVGRGLGEAPYWLAYGDTQTYVLKDTYHYVFTMNEETYSDGKIVFELGNVNGDTTTTTLTIENIRILSGGTIIE